MGLLLNPIQWLGSIFVLMEIISIHWLSKHVPGDTSNPPAPAQAIEVVMLPLPKCLLKPPCLGLHHHRPRLGHHHLQPWLQHTLPIGFYICSWCTVATSLVLCQMLVWSQNVSTPSPWVASPSQTEIWAVRGDLQRPTWLFCPSLPLVSPLSPLFTTVQPHCSFSNVPRSLWHL